MKLSEDVYVLALPMPIGSGAPLPRSVERSTDPRVYDDAVGAYCRGR